MRAKRARILMNGPVHAHPKNAWFCTGADSTNIERPLARLSSNELLRKENTA